MKHKKLLTRVLRFSTPNSDRQRHASAISDLQAGVDRGVTLSHLESVMTFVETTRFTTLITELVSDDDYAEFQQTLARFPTKGAMLEGCGGVRKVRMRAKGHGTSGGARVLYLHLPNRNLIYLLTLFTKGEAENISAAGKKAVRQLAEQIKAEHR
jgi:RelE toxin of RelE / RelB toxin-antitoxin system